MAAITVAMRTEISQLYVSLFGRAPDSEGLGFWVSSYAGGNTIAKIAQAMYETAPARAYYPLYATPSEVVTTFYSNVLGRAPDAEGLAFWVNEFNAASTPGAFFAKLVSNVVNYNGTDADGLTSQSLFNNKVAVAQFYAENDGTVAGATAALSGVTSVASTVDTAKAAILNPAPAVVAAQTFTLTTSVDEVNGGAGNDTIKGILGTSGTYGVGDNINGGSGSDTLNLISNGSGIAGGLVSIESVETINVRLLSSAGEAVTLDATDWNGVDTVTNASSLASTVLTVTGLAVTTDVKLIGQTTINAGFNNTTTASAAVNVILSDAGSGTTSTGYATLNADANSAGLISAVAVDLQGTTNAAYLEGGAAVKTYTITGSGKGYLNTNDTITSFNAAAATGNLDVTFSAASDVVAVGGSGDDTFRFGTNYTNDDSFDGGAGTDTIALTQGSFNRNLNTSNVEKATVTFSEAAGGTLNASASTVATFTIAGTAGTVSISQIAGGSTINLSDNDSTSVTLDYASGATSTTINVGSASGASDIGALTVTDVASVALIATGSGGAGVSGAISFDSDVKTVTVTNSTVNSTFNVATAEAITLSGATALTVTSSGSGEIKFGSAISAGKLATLTVNAAGGESADVTVGGTSVVGSGITSIVVNAADGADATLGALTLGTQATASSNITLTANITGASSNVTFGNITATGAGTLTLDFSQGATGNIEVGTIGLARVDASAAYNLAIDTLSVAEGATVDLGDISMVSAGSGATLSIGSITVAQNGKFTAGAVDATAVVDADLSDITISLGASANAAVGAISSTAGAVGAISLTLATGASATFGAIGVSAQGAISIASIAASADVTFGGINASAERIGAIEVVASEDGADIVMGTLIGSAIGAISVAGAGNFTMTVGSATTLGAIESTQGISGTFTIDLSGAVGAATVGLGRATNVITSGKGDDVITLTRGTTGNDTIVYRSTAQSVDYITNFAASGSGSDVIRIDASAIALIGSDSALTTGSSVVFGTASGASVTLSSAATIVLFTTAYANTAAFLADATGDLTLKGSGAMTAGNITVVWGDGQDSYVSILSFGEGVSAQDGVLSLAGSASGVSLLTIAALASVSAGSLVAANFDLG